MKTTKPWLVVLHKEPKEAGDQALLDEIHSAATEIYQERFKTDDQTKNLDRNFRSADLVQKALHQNHQRSLTVSCLVK